MKTPTEQTDLLATWRAAWPEALASWSKYTRLRDPRLCTTTVTAAREGLGGSFAMIRLMDQSVVIDMQAVSELKLEDYGVEILAHEIGHHVLAPGSVTDQFRLLARMRRALPTLERHAAMVANLYTDLFINDRLQRQANLRMADIYRALAARPEAAAAGQSQVWSLYLAIYEQLWKLDKASLGGAATREGIDTDAWLGAKLIRVYANDWMSGAGRFATLLLPYLIDDIAASQAFNYLHDTRDAAAGCEPVGILDVEGDEADGAVHPVHDSRITGLDDAPETAQAAARSRGQAREPFEYGDILKAAGIKLNDHEIAIRYYRERALPHLVRFPSRPSSFSPEPQMEGVEPWDIGDPLDEIDWMQSMLSSPRPIPGLTTVRRVFGREPAQLRDQVPVDLDIYVDSSGSMPNPQHQTSFLTLAGAVIALSALRAGSRVKATLWSGKHQVLQTPGFVRDGDEILAVLTGFFGGSTAFPIHCLRETYAGKTPPGRPVHILMISDDGITTMFDRDERGGDGWAISAQALKVADGGGTMALALPENWEKTSWMAKTAADLQRARKEQGWEMHAISAFEDLLSFAHAFSRRHYGGETARRERA